MALSTLKLMILTPMKSRIGKNLAEEHYCRAITETPGAIVLLISECLQPRLQPSAFVILSRFRLFNHGGAQEAIIYVTKETIICHKGVQFEVDQHLVDSFLKAPTVTVAVALSSPLKRRLSVTGLITNVQSPSHGVSVKGRPWQRQEVTMADPETNRPIKLSCWAGLAPPKVGALVKVTNVVTTEFRDEVRLGSTDESAFELVARTERTKSRKLLISYDDEIGDKVLLMMSDGAVLFVPLKVFLTLGNGFTMPLEMDVDVLGDEIVALTPIKDGNRPAVANVTELDTLPFEDTLSYIEDDGDLE